MDGAIVGMERMSESAVSSNAFVLYQLCSCHICEREVCRMTIEYTRGLENVLH